jgi:hypothetical protein
MAESRPSAEPARAKTWLAWRLTLLWFGTGFIFGIAVASAFQIVLPSIYRLRDPTASDLAKGGGYKFPPLAEVSNIEVECGFWEGDVTFDAPESVWGDILGALSPSVPDNEPSEHDKLGSFVITYKDGRTDFVRVFLADNRSIGAFSVGPLGTCKYYRGGHSNEIKAVLAAAYHKYLACKGAQGKGK